MLRNTCCRWQTGKVWVSQCRNLLKFDRALRLVTTWEFFAVLWCVDGAITRSLCSATKLVNAGYSIEMRPTQSVLRRSGGGCTLLQRCGELEINAITLSTTKREVQSLKSELRALRSGHLSTSEVRLPWTIEEKLRHKSKGHAEYDNRCEICVKSSVSRHPRRVYSADGCVTVLTGRGPPCERDIPVCK